MSTKARNEENVSRGSTTRRRARLNAKGHSASVSRRASSVTYLIELAEREDCRATFFFMHNARCGAMRASIWGRWLFALLLDVQPAASAVNPVRVDRAGQTDCQDASIGTLEAGECADSATDCAKWAEAGECTRNAGYMRDACRLSCELCAEEEGKAALHQVGYRTSALERDGAR